MNSNSGQAPETNLSQQRGHEILVPSESSYLTPKPLVFYFMKAQFLVSSLL